MTGSGEGSRQSHFAAWERRTRLWAVVFAVLTLAVSSLVVFLLSGFGGPAGIVLVLAPTLGVYAWQTGRIRRRHAILREPFPPEWEAVLQQDVLRDGGGS